MKSVKYVVLILISIFFVQKIGACSIFYYVDGMTGKIYFANNEDYWYDVKPYVQLIPGSKNEFGRVWYGWKHFGQGGVNEKGLVLDGAVTPEQLIPTGYSDPKKGNLTDELLANCSTTEEAVNYLEAKKIALKNAHIFLGDKRGKAVVVEWVKGERRIVEIRNNRLVATNFILSDTIQLKIDCWRYSAINEGLDKLDGAYKTNTIDLKVVGNVISKAVQVPQRDSTGRVGGTLYSTFIDLTEMKFVLVYKLDNSKIQKLDLLSVLKNGKRRKIELD